MPEHDETPAHQHEYASSPPSFAMRCKVCGVRPTKAERLGVEDKVVDGETK